MTGSTSSIGAVFDARGGRTSGFDYLRLGLALGVILWHGSIVGYGPEFDAALQETWLGALAGMILPMFFALSGFLVGRSLFRSSSLLDYVAARVLRIVPALTVVALLTTFVLGPLVTTLPLATYFGDTEIVRYLGNAVGITYVFLPGVFESNMIDWVNISLWTIHYEIICYGILLLLAVIGIAGSKRAFLACLVAAQVAAPLYQFLVTGDPFLDRQSYPEALMLSFFFGMGCYVFRYDIPRSPLLALVAFVAAFAISHSYDVYYLIGLPAAYLTVTLGLTDPRRIRAVLGGDYSYGIYIYAFPIQQMQVWLFPNDHAWWQNMAFSIPLSFAFAALSWHLLEKPMLARRRAVVAAIGTGLAAVTARARGRDRRTDP